jgi:hypothetical protein
MRTEKSHQVLQLTGGAGGGNLFPEIREIQREIFGQEFLAG